MVHRSAGDGWYMGGVRAVSGIWEGCVMYVS